LLCQCPRARGQPIGPELIRRRTLLYPVPAPPTARHHASRN
jgi:hypothetical protein